MRGSHLVSLVFAILVAASIVPPAGAESGWPCTLNDDTGAAVTVAAPPRRIVSLTLPTDEILCSLVSRSRLAAVTAFAADPVVSNVVDAVKSVPVKLSQLNVEVVVALRPDLVFVADWTDASSVRQLREAGLPVYEYRSPATVPEIESRILALGRAVGEEIAARTLVDGMEARLARVAARVTKVPPARRLTVMDYNTWGTAMGSGSSWGEIVRRAGLRNGVEGLAADAHGAVPISREKLLQIDPDILLVPAWIYGDAQGSDAFYRSIVGDPAFRGLRAVRGGRVYRMPESLKSSTSQYIVSAIEALAAMAYPDLFRSGS